MPSWKLDRRRASARSEQARAKPGADEHHHRNRCQVTEQQVGQVGDRAPEVHQQHGRHARCRPDGGSGGVRVKHLAPSPGEQRQQQRDDSHTQTEGEAAQAGPARRRRGYPPKNALTDAFQVNRPRGNPTAARSRTARGRPSIDRGRPSAKTRASSVNIPRPRR